MSDNFEETVTTCLECIRTLLGALSSSETVNRRTFLDTVSQARTEIAMLREQAPIAEHRGPADESHRMKDRLDHTCQEILDVLESMEGDAREISSNTLDESTRSSYAETLFNTKDRLTRQTKVLSGLAG